MTLCAVPPAWTHEPLNDSSRTVSPGANTVSASNGWFLGSEALASVKTHRRNHRARKPPLINMA